MKLYELMLARIAHNVLLEAPKPNPLDDDIAKTQNAFDQSEPLKPEEGEDPGSPGEPEIDPYEDKPIPDRVLDAVRDLPYVRNYSHDEKSKLNPVRLAQIPLDQLYRLSTRVQVELSKIVLIPDHDMPDIQVLRDLKEYLAKVIQAKRALVTKDRDRKTGQKRAEVKPQAPSKMKPGKVPNRKPQNSDRK